MIHIAEPVTLDKLLPLIQKLSEAERERLRDTLTQPTADRLPDTTAPNTITAEVRTAFEAILAEVKDEPGMEYDVLRDALDTMSRLDAAILFYQKDAVTFGRAAELAGIHRFELDEVFAERGLWKIVEIGPAEELRAGVEFIKRLHNSNARTEGQ